MGLQSDLFTYIFCDIGNIFADYYCMIALGAIAKDFIFGIYLPAMLSFENTARSCGPMSEGLCANFSKSCAYCAFFKFS